MKHYRKTSHSIYDIKYHICWITKYRYQVLKGNIAIRTRDLIRQICSSMDIQIISGSMGSEHIHLFISVPPNIPVSKAIQKMKGITSRKIQQEFPEIRKRYWGQHFWARGYFAVSSGNVTDEMWMEYIRNQKESPNPDTFGDFQITG